MAIFVLSILASLASSALRAQTPAPIVVEVRVEQDGRPVTDPEILKLIGTPVGEPLSMVQVREAIGHLLSLRHINATPTSEDVPGGVRVVYTLVEVRPIDGVEFKGPLGLSEALLRQALREQFGDAPSESRVEQAAARLRQVYLDRGYPSPQIHAAVIERDRTSKTLRFTIDPGPRALITAIEWDPMPPADFPRRSPLRIGQPYDAPQISGALERYVNDLHKNDYYEAFAIAGTPRFENGGVVVPVEVRRGRRVRIVWAGDPLTKKDQDRLVPIRREAAVNETLLEDWTFAIEEDLRAQGYRDATVNATSSRPGEPELVITFSIKRGPQYLVSSVEFSGVSGFEEKEVRTIFGVAADQPFVPAFVEAGSSRLAANLRAQGYIVATATAESTVFAPESPSDATRRVGIVVTVNEGARRTVRSIAFAGNVVTSATRLKELVTLTEGGTFTQAELTRSLTNIQVDYRNRGFLDMAFSPPLLSFEEGQADILIQISEGPVVVIDRISVEGNERTSRRTIERELTIAEGQPFGQSARAVSEANLMALGLFRRVRIDVRRHTVDTRADAIVAVTEALPTTLGYGGGLEVNSRLRLTDDAVGEERLEFVPRGFFEIGRRNMWGKNRSINLFSRVSARATDDPLEDGTIDSAYGVKEYRLFGTFREPRAFGTPVNLLLTGIAERAVRTSYSFETREARAEVLGTRWGDVGGVFRFSIERTELFDVNLPLDQRPLIDRFFPQVRLSKLSGSLVRDTRRRDNEPDPLDPSEGTQLSADAEFAARAIGSEVGYVKGFLQAGWYRQLPSSRRMVFAVRAAIGAAHGFRRDVGVLDADGNPVLNPDGSPSMEVVQDLPASERFFAGGSNTNRGFSNDQLGNEDTISPGGFPTGGNGEVLLNTELRAGLFRSFSGVLFVDAGNVFKRAADIRFTDLRPAAGFGVHYRSKGFPIRFELGFNLDRRELSPGGRLERGSVLIIALGPAF